MSSTKKKKKMDDRKVAQKYPSDPRLFDEFDQMRPDKRTDTQIWKTKRTRAGRQIFFFLVFPALVVIGPILWMKSQAPALTAPLPVVAHEAGKPGPKSFYAMKDDGDLSVIRKKGNNIGIK